MSANILIHLKKIKFVYSNILNKVNSRNRFSINKRINVVMNLKEISIVILSTIAIFLLSSTAILWILLKIFAPDFFLIKRKPNLIKKLPSEIPVAKEEFSLRVQDLFPLGTSDEEIRKELSKQGFDIDEYKGKEIALYENSNFFCDFEWSITWKVNDKNNIYNLKARYNNFCL